MATTEQEAARSVIIRRFQEIAQAFGESQARQKQHLENADFEQQQQNALRAVADDCHAAARVMGFDLIAGLAQLNAAGATATTPPPAPPPQQVIAPVKPIADQVLDLAIAAYPEPVRATEVQKEIEKWRGPLHYKTVGMTLYRLSKQGIVRRQGQKDWFFVPPGERTKNPGVGAPGQEDFGL